MLLVALVKQRHCRLPRGKSKRERERGELPQFEDRHAYAPTFTLNYVAVFFSNPPWITIAFEKKRPRREEDAKSLVVTSAKGFLA